MPKVTERLTRLRGGYVPLPMTEDAEDLIQVGYMSTTMELFVTKPSLTKHKRVIELSEVNHESPYVQAVTKFQLDQKMPYLYQLMDDMGFRIYAVYVIAKFSIEHATFVVQSIYADIPDQGSFIKPEQVAVLSQAIGLDHI